MLFLKNYKIRKKKEAIYIPILDSSPIYAAKSLTKEDLGLSYKILKEVFEEIRTGKIIHTILVDTVMDSVENFLWYVNFFKEIEKALGIEEDFQFPYEKCPEKHNCKEHPEFQFPFRLYSNNTVRYIKNLTSITEPVNMYRAQYILAQYDIDEFQDEVFPAWYLMKDTVIYEQYNEKTNVRVRITFMHGEFRYFISGASDNWQEITDVPLDMDHIVSALIFRSYEKA